MTPVTVDGTYENGIVRLDAPLPLKERERVRITVESPSDWVQRTAGLIPCSDPEIIREIALSKSLEYYEEELDGE